MPCRASQHIRPELTPRMLRLKMLLMPRGGRSTIQTRRSPTRSCRLTDKASLLCLQRPSFHASSALLQGISVASEWVSGRKQTAGKFGEYLRSCHPKVKIVDCKTRLDNTVRQRRPYITPLCSRAAAPYLNVRECLTHDRGASGPPFFALP